MFEKYVYISLTGDNPFPIVADWRVRSGVDFSSDTPYTIFDSTVKPWEKFVLDEIDSRVSRDTKVLVHVMPDGSRIYYREGRRGPLCIVLDADNFYRFFNPHKDLINNNRVELYVSAMFPTINVLDITKGFSVNG